MKTRKWKVSVINYSDHKTGKVDESFTASCKTRSRMREITRAIKILNSAGFTAKRIPADGIVCVFNPK